MSTFTVTDPSQKGASLAGKPIEELTREEMRLLINDLPPKEGHAVMGGGVQLLNKILDEKGPKGVIAFVAIGDHYLKAGKILRFDILGKLKKDQMRLRSELKKVGFDVEHNDQYQVPEGEVLVDELKRPLMTRQDFLRIGVGTYLGAVWGGYGAASLIERAAGGKKEEHEEDKSPNATARNARMVGRFLEGWVGDLAEIGIGVWLINDGLEHWQTIARQWEEEKFEEVSNAVDAAAEVLGIKPPLEVRIDRPKREAGR